MLPKPSVLLAKQLKFVLLALNEDGKIPIQIQIQIQMNIDTCEQTERQNRMHIVWWEGETRGGMAMVYKKEEKFDIHERNKSTKRASIQCKGFKKILLQ